MPRWVTTDWYRYRFEESHTANDSESTLWSGGIWQSNYWEPKDESVKRGIEQLAIYCNDNQYEIKSIMPLTRAQSYEYGQGEYAEWPAASNAGGWGVGYGWGINVTIGFIAILQRIEEISQEDFDKRIAARRRSQEPTATQGE